MPKLLLVYKRIFTLFFAFLVIGFFNIDRVSASATIFEDTFDSIDLTKWQVLNELDGQIQYPGMILLSSVDDKRATFMQNINEIKGSNLSIEIDFMFLNMSFGSGIAVNDTVNITRSLSHPGPTNWTIFVWPYTSNSFRVISSICPAVGTCQSDNVFAIVSGADAFNAHRLKIVYLNSKYYVYLDNILIGETIATSRIPKYTWFGNPMKTATSVSFSSFYLDKIKVADLDLSNFPYLSQLSAPWGTEIYDSADVWSSDGNTIARWGCALTSTSMVLQKHEIKMPDGNPITPLNLNNWLKSQPDGYVGGGLLNWLAITRLAKLSRDSNQAPHTLEFSRESYQASNVSAFLTEDKPVILSEPGHFVVAKEDAGSEWKLADPANETRNLASKTGFTNAYYFTPSNTDLSYMLFVTDPAVELNLAGASSYIENLTPEYGTGNVSKKITYIQKPTSNTYPLGVTGPMGSKVEAYLYDLEGNVVKDELNLANTTSAQFLIHYDPTGNNESNIALDTTPIIAYLRSMRTAKTPFNGIFQAIYSKFVEYLSYLNSGYDTTSYVADFNKFLDKQSPKHLSTSAKNTIKNYIELVGSN